MNVLLIAVCIILALSVVIGFFRGFVRILFSLVSMVVLLVVVAWATPYIAQFLKHNTGIYHQLEQVCSERIYQSLEQTLHHGHEEARTQNKPEVSAEAFGEMLPLPQSWVEEIVKNANDAAVQAVDTEGLCRQAGAYLADWILQGIAFFATYLLCSIALHLILGLLDVMSHLPVLKGVNRALGAVVGLVQGLMLVWLLLFVITIACTSQPGQLLMAEIERSEILTFLYRHNGILYLFQLIFGTV